MDCSNCLHKETCKYREKLEGDLSKDIKRLAKKLDVPIEAIEVSCRFGQASGGTTTVSFPLTEYNTDSWLGTDTYIGAGNTLYSFTN